MGQRQLGKDGKLLTFLNDKETWSDLDGCEVVVFDKETTTTINNGTCAAELRSAGKGYRYNLSDPLHLRLLADRIENERNRP
jgi:hypothetical protein